MGMPHTTYSHSKIDALLLREHWEICNIAYQLTQSFLENYCQLIHSRQKEIAMKIFINKFLLAVVALATVVSAFATTPAPTFAGWNGQQVRVTYSTTTTSCGGGYATAVRVEG